MWVKCLVGGVSIAVFPCLLQHQGFSWRHSRQRFKISSKNTPSGVPHFPYVPPRGVIFFLFLQCSCLLIEPRHTPRPHPRPSNRGAIDAPRTQAEPKLISLVRLRAAGDREGVLFFIFSKKNKKRTRSLPSSIAQHAVRPAQRRPPPLVPYDDCQLGSRTQKPRCAHAVSTGLAF